MEIKEAANKHFPKKKRLSVPWITQPTLELIEERRKIKSKGLDSEENRCQYRQANREVRRAMRGDKRRYINQQCEEIEAKGHLKNTGELYKAVRKITKKFKPRVDTVKLDDGTKATEVESVKNRWKEYCASLYGNRSPHQCVVPCTTVREPAPLLDEVVTAIQHLKKDKSPGIDELPAELFKEGGEALNRLLHRLCLKIWETEEWPEDFCQSVFVTIPKKGDVEKCENNRTIALICHASKILLKVISNRMKNKMDEEIAEEQTGFRRGRGTRDQIFNLKQIIEKYREFNKKLLVAFIDYKKAFDSVHHPLLWNEMFNMGFPIHLINLIKKLYEKQEACVRTGYGMSGWFPLLNGVRQGCGLSPLLFNLYSEIIMRKALEGSRNSFGVTIGGRKISNLRYADDVALLAESEDDLQEMLNKVKSTSEEYGLYLHPGKTKVMHIERQYRGHELRDTAPNITIDGTAIELVNQFCYLGCQINDKYDETAEIKKRIAVASAACQSLTSIWKDRAIGKATKTRLLRSLVFPIATYGAECWALTKHDRKKLESFELWCYRRMLRVSWRERRTNTSILEQVGESWRLLAFVDKLKLQFFGHLARREGLERDLMVGTTYGKRRRGAPRERWIDGVKRTTGLKMTEALHLAEDRGAWRRIIRRTTPIQHPG